jgi:hypothetical protein
MSRLEGADEMSMRNVDREVPKGGEQYSFHGGIASRTWIHVSFWDRVDVSADRIVLRPWLRRQRVVDRASIDTIGFEPVMLPLMWKSNIRFLRDGRDVLALMFTPAFKGRFRRALEDLGWPVVDLAPMSLRSVLRGR